MSVPTDDGLTRRVELKGFRVDLVIAVCALLISTLATTASWWQSRIVAQQLSAQVWPYLSFGTTYDPGYVSIELINDGLGPAIVRSAVLSVDGKPYPDASSALSKLIVRRGGTLRAQMSGLSPGSVIRASGSRQLFRLESSWIARAFAANVDRVEIRVCYCSLLGNCWLVSSRQQSGEPQPLAACPAVGAAQYRVRPILRT
jgi:hypothetical protein